MKQCTTNAKLWMLHTAMSLMCTHAYVHDWKYNFVAPSTQQDTEFLLWHARHASNVDTCNASTSSLAPSTYSVVQIADLRKRYNIFNHHTQHTQHKIGAVFFNAKDAHATNCSAVVVAAYHAREPATTNVAISVVSRLFKDPVDACDVAVVWNANPSGYHQMWSSDSDRPMQRKNAQNVDLNRNFPSHRALPPLRKYNVDANETSQTYAGSHASSEEETRVLLALTKERNANLVLCLHSHGNIIFVPKTNNTRRMRELTEESKILASFLHKHSKITFPVAVSDHPGSHTDYLVSPESPSHNQTFAYTIELFSVFFPSKTDMQTFTKPFASAIHQYIHSFATRINHTKATTAAAKPVHVYNNGTRTALHSLLGLIFPNTPTDKYNCHSSCQLYSLKTILLI